MKIQIKASVDSTQSKTIRAKMAGQLSGKSGPIHDALTKAAELYRSQLYNRFLSGADWQPLAPRTIKKKGHGRILQDTLVLLNSLRPQFQNAPGQYQQFIQDGIEIGIGGYTYANGMTIETLVNIHQNGLGFNPMRQVVIPPDQSTQAQIGNEFEKATAQIIKDANVK